MPKTLVIWNPNSGRADDAADLRARLEARHETVVRETTSAEETIRFVTRAAGDGTQVVVAAGGDGTVNSVANGLVAAGVEITMAVLPIGTANDFAQTLAVPDDLMQAFALLSSGSVRSIDLVEIQGSHQQRCFANVAAGGNSDRVTENLTDEMKTMWGPLCYLRGAVGVLADLQSYHVNLVFNDEAPFDIALWNMIIANGRTNAGHLQVAPRASIEDGLLDVILIRDGTMMDLAQLTAKFALADYLASEQVVYRQVESVTMTSEPPMRFSIDGESIDEHLIVFRAKQAALRVIVGNGYLVEPSCD